MHDCYEGDKMKLIGIAGNAGSGKDMLADYLVERHGFRKYAMAGPLKAMLRAIGVFTDTQEQKAEVNPIFNVTNRSLAQTLGTEWMRYQVCEDGWIRLAVAEIRAQRALAALSADNYPHGVVISDVRYDNEAEMVLEQGGLVVRVFRPGAEGDGHVSEAGVSERFASRTLVNWGTPDEAHAKLERALFS